jgi:hypothetical protein
VSRIAAVAVAVSMMTSGVPGYKAAGTGLCGRCRGKKFDVFTKQRSCRKCPACKGTGSVGVGGTKR